MTAPARTDSDSELALRDRSASPRSRNRARRVGAARCSSLAASRDLPPMPRISVDTESQYRPLVNRPEGA